VFHAKQLAEDGGGKGQPRPLWTTTAMEEGARPFKPVQSVRHEGNLEEPLDCLNRVALALRSERSSPCRQRQSHSPSFQGRT